ncbi:MAG: endolytic transglycosylase MltG [candidate division Zixibacteria bacterium]|nr:endolytic transglycosylase MltG [candidate division Zixibacteria bacterium]
MDNYKKPNYPGGVPRLLVDILIYIVSTVFLLLCGILRVIIEIPIKTVKLIKMKNRTISITAILILVTVVGGYIYLGSMPAGPAEENGELKLVIQKGESLISTAAKLKDASIISNEKVLISLVSAIGSPGDVKAGQYDFSQARSYLDIANLLLKGSNSPVKVTFPEGLTYREMGGIVKSRLGVDSIKFVNACRDKSLIDKYDIPAKDVEGYLFPDTYYFFYDTSADKLVRAMIERFFEVFDDSMKAMAEKHDFSMHEAVTMASLIEKETGRFDERRTVSAVFHNRLRLGMRLQCDPTVIYAIPDLNRPLMLRDLEVRSPYNTYLNYGLPPGPIANPGLGALKAAVNPEDVPYLYFVANGKGGHLFASTNRQHNNNRIKVKRKLQSQETSDN